MKIDSSLVRSCFAPTKVVVINDVSSHPTSKSYIPKGFDSGFVSTTSSTTDVSSTTTTISMDQSSDDNSIIDKKVDITENSGFSFKTFHGICCSALSSVFFCLTAVIVKHLTEVHPGQLACFRFLGIFLFTIPMVITAGVNPFGPKDKRWLLAIRGFAGATSLYLRYAALRYLPIGNATVIVLSMPVFVSIFARIFVKEACGVFHVIAIGITLLGIGFTSRINVIIGLTEAIEVDTTQELYGLLYSMGATLVGSSVYIFVRKVKECHNSVIMFNFSLVAIAETSIITAVSDGFKLPTDNISPWLLMTLAVLSFYAQLLLTKALQLEEASIVSVTRASAEVVAAFVFQIVIFQHVPDMYAIIGAVMVTSSVLLTAWYKKSQIRKSKK